MMDFTGEVQLEFIVLIRRGEGVAVDGVRAADWPRSEAQKVTLPSLRPE